MRDNGMIHKFEQNGVYIVLDINSGAVHVVDEMLYEILDYYPENSLEETVNKLNTKYENKALKEAIMEIDELIKLEQLFCEDKYIEDLNFKTREPVVKAMCLHIAHDCDLRCKYCFASQGDFKGDRSLMSYEVGQKALDFLIEKSGSRRNLEVDFFGGEPMMNFEVVKQLVTYGRSKEKEYKKNFRFTLTTNGMLLNDENTKYINENMDNVVLSLDGSKEVNDNMRVKIDGSGSYDTIVPKFQKLVEGRGNKMYYVRGTFTGFNTEFAKDVIHLADLGFKQTSIEPVVTEPHQPYALKDSDVEVVKEQYDLLAEEMIKRKQNGNGFEFFHFTVDLSQGPCVIKRLSGCGAGSEYVAITPEGEIYPCHQFVGDERFKMGDLTTNTYKTDLSLQFKNAHVYNKDKCKACWAKFYCSGGCHANAFNFNDDINIPYELGCDMERKRLECSIYIHAKLMSE